MGKFEKYLKEKEKNNVIETGKNINDSFWEDFLLVLNNSSGLSSLLGVPRSKIITWNKKIKEALKENKEKETNLSKKHKIIKTGQGMGGSH
jgi:metal-dependent hydrolase (beta-lactamase superfamily II)